MNDPRSYSNQSMDSPDTASHTAVQSILDGSPPTWEADRTSASTTYAQTSQAAAWCGLPGTPPSATAHTEKITEAAVLVRLARSWHLHKDAKGAVSNRTRAKVLSTPALTQKANQVVASASLSQEPRLDLTDIQTEVHAPNYMRMIALLVRRCETRMGHFQTWGKVT